MTETPTSLLHSQFRKLENVVRLSPDTILVESRILLITL
jgi:hypothetical protein